MYADDDTEIIISSNNQIELIEKAQAELLNIAEWMMIIVKTSFSGELVLNYSHNGRRLAKRSFVPHPENLQRASCRVYLSHSKFYTYFSNLVGDITSSFGFFIKISSLFCFIVRDDIGIMGDATLFMAREDICFNFLLMFFTVEISGKV